MDKVVIVGQDLLDDLTQDEQKELAQDITDYFRFSSGARVGDDKTIYLPVASISNQSMFFVHLRMFVMGWRYRNSAVRKANREQEFERLESPDYADGPFIRQVWNEVNDVSHRTDSARKKTLRRI